MTAIARPNQLRRGELDGLVADTGGTSGAVHVATIAELRRALGV